MRTPDGQVSSQGWVVAWGDDEVAPVFLSEFAILRSCSFVLEYLKTKNVANPPLIVVTAGRTLEQARLLRWFCEGRMGLESAAASQVVDIFRDLAAILPCPMVLSHTGVQAGWAWWVVSKIR